MTQGWTNRIVGHGEEAPDQLLANPRNFRLHPGSQADALAGVLDEVGIVQSVIVNQRTGYLVDGHLRVSLALRQGQPMIPVVYVDLDEAEEAKVLATLDPISTLAGTDAAKLDELLRDVDTGSAAVQVLLDGIAAKAGIVPGQPVDPNELWQGMPEFEHEDKTAYRSLTVHFKDQDAVNAFAELMGQVITDRTRFLWHPKQEVIRYGEAD